MIGFWRVNFDHMLYCTVGKSEIINTDLISNIFFLHWKSKFVSSRHRTTTRGGMCNIINRTCHYRFNTQFDGVVYEL